MVLRAGHVTKGTRSRVKQAPFFQYFTFAKVRRLQKFLGSSEEATKTFFDTLSEGFGSELNFARFLSIEKQSLLNGDEAEKLQKELLTFWKKTKSEEEVLKLIDLVKQGWIYETLDTLVQFVALRDSLEPKDVDTETVKLIIDKLGDGAITQSINNGKEKKAQPITSYFGVVDDEADVASEKIKHIDLAEKLLVQLGREWKSDEDGLNDMRRKVIQWLGNKLDQKSSLDLSLKPSGKFDQKLSLDLSLKPPGKLDQKLSLDLSLKPPGT